MMITTALKTLVAKSVHRTNTPAKIIIASTNPTNYGLRTTYKQSKFLSTASVETNVSNLSKVAGGTFLKSLVNDNPYTDVVQYQHQNRIFSVKDIDYNAEALAIGIAENGLIPGDVVLSYLPQHFNEQMIIQFACSKAGFVLYTLDPAMAISDPEKAKRAIESALTLTKANVLISQEAANDVNYIRLVQSVVPELRFFDFSTGMPFVTPHFPHLRFCIHTGMDQDDKWGWLPLHHMVVPSNNLDEHIDLTKIHSKTPLAGQFVLDKDGIPTGLDQTLTNEQVYEKNLWPTYCNVLERKFHLIEGIGVNF